MKKFCMILCFVFLLSGVTPAFATNGINGKITPKSIGAAACSLIIWPGVGQVINDQDKEKSLVHAVLGLTGVFRIWSCYDALVDRDGGVWENRI